jgi:hypothetical protein
LDPQPSAAPRETPSPSQAAVQTERQSEWTSGASCKRRLLKDKQASRIAGHNPMQQPAALAR